VEGGVTSATSEPPRKETSSRVVRSAVSKAAMRTPQARTLNMRTAAQTNGDGKSSGEQNDTAMDSERSDRSPGARATTTEGTASMRASTRTLEGDESAGDITAVEGGPPDNPMSHVMREREERRRFVEEDDDERDLVRELIRPEWQAALWSPDSLAASTAVMGSGSGHGTKPPLRRVLSLGALSPSSTPDQQPPLYYRPAKVTLPT
jgi:hypothetical protein